MGDEELDARLRAIVQRVVSESPSPPPFDQLAAAAPHEPSRRKRVLVLATAALVTIVGAVFVIAWAGAGDDRHQVTTRPAPRVPARCPSDLVFPDHRRVGAPIADPQWVTLPPGPTDGRVGAAAVWTGKELIVWGGEEPPGSGHLTASGAALDPARQRWRRIAAAPLTPRSDHVAVWTGREMIVWGLGFGRVGPADGAAYDPGSDTWRALPSAPIDATGYAKAVWTGREMIVWGAVAGDTAGGAAYDPCTNSWRRIADSPLSPRFAASAVWTGSEMIVWGGNGTNNFPIYNGAAYDPATDRWRTLPPVDVHGYYAPSAVWTGTEMVVWGWSNVLPYPSSRADENEAVAYNPNTDTWRPLPSAPLVAGDEYEGTGDQAATWGDDRMYAWTGSLDAGGPLALSFDPATGTWERLPTAPVSPDGPYAQIMTWTGTDVIVLPWGGAGQPGVMLTVRTR